MPYCEGVPLCGRVFETDLLVGESPCEGASLRQTCASGLPLRERGDETV